MSVVEIEVFEKGRKVVDKAKKRRKKRKEWLIFRSSRPQVFCKKGVLRNYTKFTGKHQSQSLFFNKVAGA